MKTDIALQRYLERHIEPDLPSAPATPNRWQHALVIPVYDEPPEFIQTLAKLRSNHKVLVIVVLNRPDSDNNTQVNSPLRDAIGELTKSKNCADKTLDIFQLHGSVELYCYDMEKTKGPNPSAQGVGLARKVGCDIALLWQSQGAISGNWICSSDADSRLPDDYFDRLSNLENSVAAVYPYTHKPGPSKSVNRATTLYELKLHQYVLGLRYAHSPYAYHTLGSCIAVHRLHYAQVRGYPKRSGGEDFYLLNKLAKLGTITSLNGKCISITSRASHRVPFGTGPATEKIIAEDGGEASAIFYHPQCFEALRVILKLVEQFRLRNPEKLEPILVDSGLSTKLAKTTAACLHSMNIANAIEHCRKHGKTESQFIRQFHQWFDGFRTLKFIHAIRDASLPMVSLRESMNLQPCLFPNTTNAQMNTEAIRSSVLRDKAWLTDSMPTSPYEE